MNFGLARRRTKGTDRMNSAARSLVIRKPASNVSEYSVRAKFKWHSSDMSVGDGPNA